MRPRNPVSMHTPQARKKTGQQSRSASQKRPAGTHCVWTGRPKHLTYWLEDHALCLSQDADHVTKSNRTQIQKVLLTTDANEVDPMLGTKHPWTHKKTKSSLRIFAVGDISTWRSQWHDDYASVISRNVLFTMDRTIPQSRYTVTKQNFQGKNWH